MKSTTWLACCLLLASHTALADESGQSSAPATVASKLPGWQPAPANVKQWADRCSDPTVNGWGLKDPKNFVRLVEQFSTPAIYQEFALRMQDPEAYAGVVKQLLEPATAKNYLEWVDPSIYGRWLMASIDPNFYIAALRPLLDPGTYLRWLALPIDQRTWAVAFNGLNPATWAKWMTAPVNPKVLEPLAKALDPNTPLKWLQATGDSNNFRGWNGWLPGLTTAPSVTPANGLASAKADTAVAVAAPGNSMQTPR